MESIHHAANDGQVDIINALVNEYGVDPNSKVSYVLVYILSFSYVLTNFTVICTSALAYIHSYLLRIVAALHQCIVIERVNCVLVFCID